MRLVFVCVLGYYERKTFIGIVKKKSTENYKGIPYVTTLLSTSLWTFYGLLKPDGLLVTTVNGAGVLFQLSYVILFIIFAPKDKKVILSLSLSLIILIYLLLRLLYFKFHPWSNRVFSTRYSFKGVFREELHEMTKLSMAPTTFNFNYYITLLLRGANGLVVKPN